MTTVPQMSPHVTASPRVRTTHRTPHPHHVSVGQSLSLASFFYCLANTTIGSQHYGTRRLALSLSLIAPRRTKIASLLLCRPRPHLRPRTLLDFVKHRVNVVCSCHNSLYNMLRKSRERISRTAFDKSSFAGLLRRLAMSLSSVLYRVVEKSFYPPPPPKPTHTSLPYQIVRFVVRQCTLFVQCRFLSIMKILKSFRGALRSSADTPLGLLLV